MSWTILGVIRAVDIKSVSEGPRIRQQAVKIRHYTLILAKWARGDALYKMYCKNNYINWFTQHTQNPDSS